MTAEMRLVPHLQHKPLSFFRKAFSLPTATQILMADRHGQPLFVAFSPALISAISFFISKISTLRFSSHSSRVVAYHNTVVMEDDSRFRFQKSIQKFFNSRMLFVMAFFYSAFFEISVFSIKEKLSISTVPFLISNVNTDLR